MRQGRLILKVLDGGVYPARTPSLSLSSHHGKQHLDQPLPSETEVGHQTGKVIFITGGTGGIGKETARVLLTKNATVYIAGRNEAAGKEAVEALTKETGKAPIFIKLDLANLKSIRGTVEEFQSKESKLDVLFNSAGVMFPPIASLTPDGYDLQFGTNVLGHFHLTTLLLPFLLSSASSTSQARIVTVSSMGHQVAYTAPGILFDTLRDGPERIKMGTHKLYGQSKFGNILFSNELARRYGQQGIVSIALHPGNIKTDLARHSGTIQSATTNWMLYPVELGALTQLYAGTAPEASALGGKYLLPWARLGKPHPQTNDAELAAKMWRWCEAQVKGM
ncbi:NAD-binding protein [Roridomyces roridus]|uniref:NAD-binding protein n=1 Tax=Roridomyces roridus TaxID=1738132 RepID=A0AAD7C8P8_9AGAR|nr:NAD-binding protein [Roridomyces roridus]